MSIFRKIYGEQGKDVGDYKNDNVLLLLSNQAAEGEAEPATVAAGWIGARRIKVEVVCTIDIRRISSWWPVVAVDARVS